MCDGRINRNGTVKVHIGRGKALWSTWLNTLHYCQYDPEVECSIPAGVFFHILYINNNSDKLLVLPEVLVMPHIFLPDSGHSSEFQCHSSGIYEVFIVPL